VRAPQTPLEEQVEAAFDYRGDVTVKLSDGSEVVGFVFNRDFAPPPSLRSAPFLELYLPDGGKQTLPLERVAGVELTGKDHAEAGAPQDDAS
jgi:hypothetical protein